MTAYKLTDEVRAALGEGRVVALESSIICQGMPWPHNLETAQAMEAAIREEGGVPATVAVIDGEVRVGLSRALITT
ncbi:MAG: pseudouridine-5'-phosphate glycosidase [Chitinophagales bacterium]